MSRTWYELMLRWGAISFAVVVLIPVLGLMPELSVAPGWWTTREGIIYLLVAFYLFVSGLVGFIGAYQYETKRVNRSNSTRRNVIYALVALNFFAGTVYYLGYAVWRSESEDSA